MHPALPGLLQHHRDRGLEVLDAAGDVGIVAGAAGAAVAVVVHGPHVVAVAREHVHERIFALARHGEVVGRARGVGGAVHQEQDRQRRLAGARRADALAPEVELHAALVRPVVGAPDRAVGGLAAAAPVVCACAEARPDTRPAPMPRPAPLRMLRRAGSAGSECWVMGVLRGRCSRCRFDRQWIERRIRPYQVAGAGVRSARAAIPGRRPASPAALAPTAEFCYSFAGHRPHARRSIFSAQSCNTRIENARCSEQYERDARPKPAKGTV